MSDFATRMERVQALVEAVERRGGEVAETSRELLAAVLDWHREGLSRALEIANEQGVAGGAVVRAFAADPSVASVLLLHGLHPDSLESRAAAALARIESALGKRGARAALVGIEEGVIRVTVAGGQSGARALVEEALVAAAPDAEGIRVDEEPDVGALVSVDRLVSQVGRRSAP